MSLPGIELRQFCGNFVSSDYGNTLTRLTHFLLSCLEGNYLPLSILLTKCVRKGCGVWACVHKDLEQAEIYQKYTSSRGKLV